MNILLKIAIHFLVVLMLKDHFLRQAEKRNFRNLYHQIDSTYNHKYDSLATAYKL